MKLIPKIDSIMMKKFLLLLIGVCGMMCPLRAQASTADVMIAINDTIQMPLSTIISKNLPVICVETVDNVEPSCEIVPAPPGAWGSTSNSPKLPGRIVMYKRINGVDSVVYDSGDYEEDKSGMRIKIRGNTSARADKKPYKIKLEKKYDLLFRGDESTYKDKDWLLLNDEYLLTTTAFRICRMVGMPWVPGCEYVNLIINGRYRGFYLLCESVKRNEKCRLNVDKDWGFIFECDLYWWNEPVYVTSYQAPSYNYTFKYPDEDDITVDQLAYMQILVNEFETILNTENYADMIDVHSFAAWSLVHDIMGTKDGGGCNRFYTKYDTTAESKIMMPVAWDFDLAERSGNDWSRCHQVYMNQLFNNPNRAFVGEFVRLWCRIRESFRADITAELNVFLNSTMGRAVEASFPIDNITWSHGSRLFDRYVSGHILWFWSRYDWLDGSIMALHVPNDINFDGVVNVSDVTELIGGVLGYNEVYQVIDDVNGDNDVNVADVTALIQLILNN